MARMLQLTSSGISHEIPTAHWELMAYQRTIIKASKNFEGTAWVPYDRCYHHQAAAVKTLEWANIDSALYNEAFTGRARSILRCQVCLRDNHTEPECPDRPLLTAGPSYGGPGSSARWTPPAYVGQSRYAQQPTRAGRPGSQEVCQLFNRVRCKAVWCKRRHVCNRCGLPHPEVVCTMQARQGDRPRSPHLQRGTKPN